jgi:tetratricopeptide (TPR) repeat protein
MRNRFLNTIGPTVVLLGTIQLPLPAQVNPGWIGKWVVPRSNNFTLLVNGEAIDRSRDGVDLYRVEQVDGTTLLLKAEADGASGWAERDQVVLAEHAVEFFTQRIHAQPGNAFDHTARAILWIDKKEYANALGDYNEAIRLDPRHASYYRGRGRVWQLKREYEQAIADFNEAIKLDPKSARAFIGRGTAWGSQKKYGMAIDDASEAIWLDPLAIAAYEIRGHGWSSKKEFAKAIVDYTTVLRLDSRRVQTYCDRGDAWAAMNRYDKALSDFNDAIQIDEKCASAHGSRASIWATCPNGKYRDGPKAVASATRACELTGYHDVQPIEALAAAHAETGDFDSAVKWQTRAIGLRKGDAQKRVGEGRLRLFQQKKPLRDPDA